MGRKILLTIMGLLCIALTWWLYNKPIFSEYAQTFEVSLSKGSIEAPICQVGALEFSFINGKRAESCKTNKENFSLERFLAKFNGYIVHVEYTNGSVNYYAYSPKIRYLEIVGGKKVNLHVSVGKNQVTLGTPIIYGGY